MTKVLHLLSDQTFVDGHIYRFENTGLLNTYIFLQNEKVYAGAYRDRVLQVAVFSAGFEKIKETAAGFDLIFIYNLDYPKACIINGIGKKIPVVWYFYGTELYNELPAFKFNIYSPGTKKLLHINAFTSRLYWWRRFAGKLKYAISGTVPTYTVIRRCMQRVNYITFYSKEEYGYLQANTPFPLPFFLPLPVFIKDDTVSTLPEHQNTRLLLGHSATPDDNHIDIIVLLRQCNYRGKVLAPLSYGEHKQYTSRIKQALIYAGLQVEVLDRFLDFDLYHKKIGGCSAAVFNSYRQIALGNITLALKNSLKIYLNEKNPSYRWLLNAGFYVCSVQQHLEADIREGRLYLLPEQIETNRAAYLQLTDAAHNQAYIASLQDIVTVHKNTSA